jgi:adenine-specific DNA-methyltransferase
MAKKTKALKPTAKAAEVESYKHKEARRRNIPTAELQKLVPDDDKAIKKLRWPRNPDLDPQLVWRGKDFEADPLEVDAPPIYIQEKIQPRAIIEDLRRQTKERRADDASQFDFFHDFNGLADPEAKTEFYAHDQNWSNRMILGDSLLVMASLAEREALRGKVQCIYFDPPYGIKFNSNWQPSTKTHDVREGKEDSVTREPEVIRAFRDTWNDGINSYLGYLRDRLVLARELLNERGSIFIQIGDENLHVVRSLMDEVFGPRNFISQITLQKAGTGSTVYLPGICDFLVWYGKDKDQTLYHDLFVDRDVDLENVGRFSIFQRADGTRTSVSEVDLKHEKGRLVAPDPIQSASQGREKGEGASNWFPVEFCGRTFRPNEKRRWSTNEKGFQRLVRSDRVLLQRDSIRFARYLDDFEYVPLTNIWNDTAGAVDRIYVVQTADKVIERCLLMTTNPGDLVFDPTCGSGTTAYVSERWGRRWITVDTSRVALTLARARLMGAQYEYYLLNDTEAGAHKVGEMTNKPPAAGPFGNNIKHGFVYRRSPKITLGNIVRNAEIDVIWDRWQKTLEPLRERLNKATKESWEEWQVPREPDKKWADSAKQLFAQWWEGRRERQKEIDESIARNAEIEFLYDRPYKERGVVRVAGPFTVESLSPHRVLPMGEDPYLEELLAAGEEPSTVSPAAAKEDVDDRVKPGHDEKGGQVITDFAQVVYENLKAAGVQNTKKGETLRFEWLKPFASRSGLIQFEGRYQEKGESKRAAVCIGPEYDTVGYDLVRRSAREAADLFDTLIICGFAFAPEVDDTRLNFGSLTVLKARMNQDLRMAEKLKATGAGNLFVVFGEPDIVIHKLKDDMLKVEIRGMDIFDPTTGEVRSSGGKELMNDVAAWFIDNDYDEESFFVRQAYFVGDDPYEGLKRALKADIDETAWAELNSTVSRPFPRPKHGRICVKVINHFGDEVQKVFQV